MATINRITAETDLTGYLVKIYSGTGPLSNSESNATHNDRGYTVTCDLGTKPPGNTYVSKFSTNFNGYPFDRIAGIYFGPVDVANRKGGVVIKQTTFPPKAGNENKDKKPEAINYENDAESLAFKVDELDLWESGGQWNIKIDFLPSGTVGFDLVNASMVDFTDNGVTFKVLEIRVSPRPSGTAPMQVNLNDIDFAMGVSVPFVITQDALDSNKIYHKKGMFQINA